MAEAKAANRAGKQVVHAGMDQPASQISAQAPFIEPTPAELDDDGRMFVCKAAIAEVFGRPYSSMHSEFIEAAVVRVSYTREDDKSKWTNDCKLDGNRVVWAAVHGGVRGHWREDELVYWSKAERALHIEQRWSDGTSTRKAYSF